MPVSTRARVQKHRDTLRAAGLRPVQIWVPDTRHADFAVECARQAAVMAQADRGDPELMTDVEAALEDAADWT